jgi:hypothetical protein
VLKGKLIHEKNRIRKSRDTLPLRRPLVIYDFATAPSMNLLMNEKNLIFFFISAEATESYPPGLFLLYSAKPGGSVEYK